MLSVIQKRDEVARFPQAPLPAFTPLHLQSACSPPSRIPWKRSRLLSLPTEIRLIIYEHLFASETISSKSLDFKSSAPYQRVTAQSKGQLLLTCRKIAAEATPFLYANHVFCFRHAYRTFRFKHAFVGRQPYYTTNLPNPISVFGSFPRARLASLSHVSVSYLIDNDSADEINGFDSRTRWSSTDTGTLDEHLAELVRIFRESCPRMKSFTLEMVTGSSPHPLRNYSTADIEVSGKRTTTGLFGKTLAYNVRKELKKMVCSEEGCLKRVRLVAVTESGEDGKTMQIVGAGSTRWHEIEYRLTDDEPMWVFMVDKVFKKDRKKADRR